MLFGWWYLPLLLCNYGANQGGLLCNCGVHLGYTGIMGCRFLVTCPRRSCHPLGCQQMPWFQQVSGAGQSLQCTQLPWGLRVEFPPLFLSGRSNPSPCHINCVWLSTPTVLLWGKGEGWIFIQCLLYGRNCSALRNFINGIKWLSRLYVGCHIAIEW